MVSEGVPFRSFGGHLQIPKIGAHLQSVPHRIKFGTSELRISVMAARVLLASSSRCSST